MSVKKAACSRALRQAERFTGKVPAVIMEVRGWSEKLATDSEAAVRAGSQPVPWYPRSLRSFTRQVAQQRCTVQVKADRHVRDVAFAVLQADSVAALREAEIFDTYCADCEPVSYLTGAPVVQRKGFRPLSRLLKGWKRGR